MAFKRNQSTIESVSFFSNECCQQLVVVMGSVASVMQFKCAHCQRINPTERQSCFACGVHRSQAVDNHEVTTSDVLLAGRLFVPAAHDRPTAASSSKMQSSSTDDGKSATPVGSTSLARTASHLGDKELVTRERTSNRNKSHSQLKHSVSYSSTAGV